MHWDMLQSKWGRPDHNHDSLLTMYSIDRERLLDRKYVIMKTIVHFCFTQGGGGGGGRIMSSKIIIEPQR